MLRLVETEFGAAGKLDGGEKSETGFRDGTADRHTFTFEIGDCRVYVVAHKVELVMTSLLRWMDSQLSGRQGENQPAVSCVDRRKFEDVAKKRAHFVCVIAVKNCVSSCDHDRVFSYR